MPDFPNLIPPGAKWIYAPNAIEYKPGDMIGWPSSKSPTRFFGGVVVMSDVQGERVLVRDIKPAEVRPGDVKTREAP